MKTNNKNFKNLNLKDIMAAAKKNGNNKSWWKDLKEKVKSKAKDHGIEDMNKEKAEGILKSEEAQEAFKNKSSSWRNKLGF